MMKVRIRSDEVEVTDLLRAHVEGRVRLALARFADRIVTVSVRFSSGDGDPSAPHKRCQIRVGLRPRSVYVEDTDADLFAAVNHLTARAARSVAHTLERQSA